MTQMQEDAVLSYAMDDAKRNTEIFIWQEILQMTVHLSNQEHQAPMAPKECDF